jgi:hypothetical protein
MMMPYITKVMNIMTMASSDAVEDHFTSLSRFSDDGEMAETSPEVCFQTQTTRFQSSSKNTNGTSQVRNNDQNRLILIVAVVDCCKQFTYIIIVVSSNLIDSFKDTDDIN